MRDLLNDINRDLSQYISGMDNYEEELNEITKRLDLINHLKVKYGNSIDQILDYCRECEKKLDKYRDYDAYRENLAKLLKTKEDKAISFRLNYRI